MDDNGERVAAADEQASPAASVGQTLSAARLSQGLSLEDLSAELRIETKQLLALEQDEFGKIGVPVFIKGYLRQYGQRLGLHYNDLLALYYRQVDTQEVDLKPSRTIKLRDERQITVWVLALVVLGVLAAFLFVWWINDPSLRGLRPSRANESAPADTSAPDTSAPESNAGSGTGRVAEPASAPTGRAVSSGAGFAARAARAASRPEGSRRPESSALGVGVDASAVVSVPTDATADPSAATPPSSVATDAAGTELDVTFDEDSWAEIEDSRGTRLFYGLGQAGRSLQLHGEPPFSTLLGNAAGVRLVVGGEPFTVPGGNRADQRVRFTIAVPEE